MEKIKKRAFKSPHLSIETETTRREDIFTLLVDLFGPDIIAQKIAKMLKFCPMK